MGRQKKTPAIAPEQAQSYAAMLYAFDEFVSAIEKRASNGAIYKMELQCIYLDMMAHYGLALKKVLANPRWHDDLSTAAQIRKLFNEVAGMLGDDRRIETRKSGTGEYGTYVLSWL